MRHWRSCVLWHQPFRSPAIRGRHDPEQRAFLEIRSGLGVHCRRDADTKRKTICQQARICGFKCVRTVVFGIVVYTLRQFQADGCRSGLHTAFCISRAYSRHHGHILQGENHMVHGRVNYTFLHRCPLVVLDPGWRSPFGGRRGISTCLGPHLCRIHHRDEPGPISDVIL